MDISMLDSGNLIYRKKKSTILFWVLLGIFGLLAYYVVKVYLETGELDKGIGLVSLFPLVFAICLYFSDRQIPAYYEKGILLYKGDQPNKFIPFEEISKIRCYHEYIVDEKIEEDGDVRIRETHRYGITFWHEGREIACLQFENVYDLKNIWTQLSQFNPGLNDVLRLQAKTRYNANLYRDLTGRQLRMDDSEFLDDNWNV